MLENRHRIGVAERVSAATAVSFLLMAALTGCLPSAGNSQPFSWTMDGEEAIFRWCGEPTQRWNYIEIDYATFEGGRQDFALAQGSGSFKLDNEEFTSIIPPAGASYSRSGRLVHDNGRILVTINLGISYEQLNGPFVIFDIDDIAKLRGMWLHPNGELTEHPC